MSEHRSSLVWERGERAFEAETYAREHRVTTGAGMSFLASAAHEFHGDPALTNPEELFVAALSSCHMLTFLAICARKKIGVDRYEDAAVGMLERPEGAPMFVTRVTLRPRVVFSAEPPSPEALQALHDQAHRGCFIASSVKTVVTVEPA